MHIQCTPCLTAVRLPNEKNNVKRANRTFTEKVRVENETRPTAGHREPEDPIWANE